MTIPRPDITIFADASFCPKTKAAGWAAWIIGGGKRSFTTGGKIKANVPQSYDAETFAIVNALYAARAAGYITRGQVVMMQCDCLLPLNIIASHIPNAVESRHVDGLPIFPIKLKKINEPGRAALESIRSFVSETDIVILVRHVRGHQPGRGRAWVNEQCDKVAKRYMRAARAEFKKASRK